jgi:hypothetical protein
MHAGAPARDARIAVGVRASAMHIGHEGPDGAGLGVLLRFRTRPVELELEVGHDEYGDGANRSDTRIGGSLYVPLVSGRLVPYLVAGTGMSFSYFKDTRDDLHQGYLAGGGGLSLALGARFVIGLDGRFMLRQFFDDQARVDAQPLHGSDGQTVEVRLGGLVYF